jgi:hypothetical protein
VSAADQLEAVSRTDAGRAGALAQLLQQALDHHQHEGDGPCPVCGQADALSPGWRSRTEDATRQLEQDAAAARIAQDQARSAAAAVQQLVHPLPDLLAQDAADIGIDLAPVRMAWVTWAGLPVSDGQSDGLRALAEHLTAHRDELVRQVAAVAEAASRELAAREDRWTPIAAQVASWCREARPALAGQARLAEIKAAETWMKGAIDGIRSGRFTPLADRAKAMWSDLRQESNVDIGAIRLAGAANQRHVDIDVQVDGTPGSALGVMSQGEVNALALSVFLPRATMPESPFRFLVIDDPVQAMDPAKVDGLARVLERVARDRQVLVFSHDDRLPEALRRLDIPATLLEVTRQPGSHVAVALSTDPARRALEDAGAVCADTKLPTDIKARIVGGLCRIGLEAAFTEIARQKLLQSGRRHAEVDELLCDAHRLYDIAALALFADKSRAGDVLGRLKQLHWRHPETLKHLNKSAHAGSEGDVRALVSDTRRLVDDLRQAFA